MQPLLFVFSRPPYGGINAREGLDALLMGTVLMNCSLLFVDEGVYQLLNHQDTEALGIKNSADTLGSLEDLKNIYCRRVDLENKNLTMDDLILPATVLDLPEVHQLLESHSAILNF